MKHLKRRLYKTQRTIFFGFSVILAFIGMQVLFATTSNSIEKICAQPDLNGVPMYYGNPLMCNRSDTSRCPPGMSEINEGSDNNRATCRRRTESRFCEVMTGSGEAFTNGSGSSLVYYCRSTPLRTIGSCNNNDNFNLRAVPTDFPNQYFDIMRDIIAEYDTSPDDLSGSRPFDLLDKTTACEEAQPDSNDDNTKGRYLKIPIFLFREASYSHIDNKRAYLDKFIVNTIDFDPTSRYDSYRNIDKLIALSEMGLIIQRQSTNFGNIDRFCANPNDVMVRSDSGRYCYTGLTQGAIRPCIIESVGGDFCYAGRLRGVPASDLVYFNNTTDSNLRTKALTYPSDDYRCKSNAIDVFQFESNKGCSAYTETERDATGDILPNNRVVVKPGLRRDYERCLKCLYNTDEFNDIAAMLDPNRDKQSIPGLITRDNVEILSPNGLANMSSSNLEGRKIDPNSEPFLQSIQGRFYNELGCIDSNNPSGIVNTIVRFALGFMSILVIFRIIQGALKFQDGDPESVQEAKDIITSAIVAIIVLIFSVGIVEFVGINILQIT